MTALDITNLCHDSAGTCDGCAREAVELLVIREDDPFRCTLRYCRACAGDDSWHAPDAEFEIGATLDLFGQPIDAPTTPERHEQLGLLEVAPTSTFDAPAPTPMRGDTTLF